MVIKRGKFGWLRAESAVFHFSPNKTVSKYELLSILKDVLKRNVNIKPTISGDRQFQRILKSRYEGLKSLFGHDKPMVDAIRQLAGFI